MIPRHLVPALCFLLAASGCASSPRGSASMADGDGEEANAPVDVPWEVRHARPTHLVNSGPAPALPSMLHPGPDMETVRYLSGDLLLMAVVARPPQTPSTPDTQPGKLPAVVLLHKGFALDDDTLAAAGPFVAAGFIVMMPSWRGENGNPGVYELWRGEVDDAKAATRWLAEDAGVDVDRLYVFGHSAGGGLATLLALDEDVPFRIIASSNGVYAMGTFGRWAKEDPKKVPFALDDVDEANVRCLVPNAHELEHPLTIYVGSDDPWSRTHAVMARTRAAAAGKMIDVVELPGDHMGSLPAALARFLDAVVRDAYGPAATPVALR